MIVLLRLGCQGGGYWLSSCRRPLRLLLFEALHTSARKVQVMLDGAEVACVNHAEHPRLSRELHLCFHDS